MKHGPEKQALLVAGFADSIIRFRGQLLTDLQTCGFKVHVAAPGLDSESVEGKRLVLRGIVPHDLPLARTGMNPVQDAKALLALVRLVSSVRPRLVLSYTIKAVIYGSLAAWIVRVPGRYALITGLGRVARGLHEGISVTAGRLLYGVSLRTVTKVIFQNPDDRGFLLGKRLLPRSKPFAIVNGSGVDLVEFYPSPLPGGQPSFLMIARLLGEKGIREYARAASVVRLRYPDVRFVLAGWIDDNPDAIGQVELDAWSAEGTLEFVGRLEDVRPTIAGASVYVLPSYYREGTPRSVLEALAMGRPVITTDTPGCRETVVDGVNGFLVPARSVDALAEAMLKLIEQPCLVERMGRRSRQIAEEKYDVHKVNAVMLREMDIAAELGSAH